jgi:hypothetical protein
MFHLLSFYHFIIKYSSYFDIKLDRLNKEIHRCFMTVNYFIMFVLER